MRDDRRLREGCGEMRTARCGEGSRARRIFSQFRDGSRKRRRIFARYQHAILVIGDQFARALRRSGNHWLRRRPGFQYDIAERFMA